MMISQKFQSKEGRTYPPHWPYSAAPEPEDPDVLVLAGEEVEDEPLPLPDRVTKSDINQSRVLLLAALCRNDDLQILREGGDLGITRVERGRDCPNDKNTVSRLCS